jgi:putative endonuclease
MRRNATPFMTRAAKLCLMFVYVLASKSRVLYVGVTADLRSRMWQHRTGALPGFTRRYGVNQLVYYEETDNPTGAIHREKQIKGWARIKKVAMIESMNPEWNDLAERWFVDVSLGGPSHPLGMTSHAPLDVSTRMHNNAS